MFPNAAFSKSGKNKKRLKTTKKEKTGGFGNRSHE